MYFKNSIEQEVMSLTILCNDRFGEKIEADGSLGVTINITVCFTDLEK